METCLQTFIIFKLNDWTWFLLIAEFVYNNAKNANTSHTLFGFNYGYYFCIFYKKNLDLYSKLKIAKKQFFKLQKLMTIY